MIRSSDIDVASNDNATIVEQILKLMKPHIEEIFVFESEAAKIFTEKIQGVMRSAETMFTLPHRPTTVIHTIYLSSLHTCI